jgi:hypothetical protein
MSETEPSLDHAFAWLRAQQIAPDPLAMRQARADPDYDRRARAVRDVFRTPAGELALETILQATIFRAPVDHRLPTETEYLRYAQLRTGQNQAAATILAYIAHAKQLEKDDHAPADVSVDPSDVLAGGRAYGGASAGAEPEPGSWLDFLADGDPASAVR